MQEIRFKVFGNEVAEHIELALRGVGVTRVTSHGFWWLEVQKLTALSFI